MPTIGRFFGIVIAMYFDDHGLPHFHARHAEGSAKVRIDTLEMVESSFGRPPASPRARLGRAAPGRAPR